MLTEQIFPSALRLLSYTHFYSIDVTLLKTKSNYSFLRFTAAITPDNIAASGISETVIPVSGLSPLFGVLLSLGT